MTWRPTESQVLLVRAAVLPGDAALEAWHQWRAQGGVDDVDPASHRLFAQVYRNLPQLGIDEPAVAALREAYGESWSRNQQLLHHAGRVLADLHDAGIATLVLKGAALAALHYPDVGARPMDDVDVLVAPAQVEEAMRVLQRAGWSPGREVTWSPADNPRALIPVRHAIAFDDEAGHQLDLHWYSLWQSAPDDAFWQTAVPLTIAGVQTRALDPTDQLLHVCVHGCGRAPGPVRWVADAGMLVRAEGPGIDWDRLVDAARTRRLSLITERALRVVQTELGLDVPPAALAALRHTRTTPHERWGDRVTIRPPKHGGMYVAAWDRYRRLRALDPSGPTPSGFALYLQRLLGLRSRWGLVRQVARNAGNAVRSRLGR
jgi:hypothetical protein